MALRPEPHALWKSSPESPRLSSSKRIAWAPGSAPPDTFPWLVPVPARCQNCLPAPRCRLGSQTTNHFCNYSKDIPGTKLPPCLLNRRHAFILQTVVLALLFLQTVNKKFINIIRGNSTKTLENWVFLTFLCTMGWL